MQSYTFFNSQGWKGLIAPDWRAQLEPLQEWLSQNPGEVLVRLPNREVRRISTPQGILYVKLLNAGGSLGGAKGAFTDLKWLVRPSRAKAILRISQALLDAGFRCPIPVLAARRRSPWGWPRDVFISVECAGTPITELLPEMTLEERNRLLSSVACELSRFHREGFVHGDCIPGNIALAPDGRIIFFDHDRTIRRSNRVLLQHQQRRNLVQFGFRLSKYLKTLGPFEHFLADYAQNHWESTKAALEIARIMSLVQKRLGSVHRNT